MAKFSNAEVGDKVCHLVHGDGVVLSGPRPYLLVRFPRITLDFWSDGRHQSGDYYPSLFWGTLEELEITEAPEPVRLPALKVDTKILVRNWEYAEWVRRHFSHWDGRKAVCFQGGATSWATTCKQTWPFWKLPED